MRILCVYAGRFPWDVRVEKMALSLTAAGHEFHVLCANFDGEERYEHRGAIYMHRLPATGKGTSLLNQALSVPVHANPFWALSLARVAARVRPDLLLVRDLQLSLLAIAVARAARVPVVLDLAENWPSLLREWKRFEGPSVQNLLFRSSWASSAIESAAVRAVDHVLVVVEEMQQRLEAKGVDPSRISVITNVPMSVQTRPDPGLVCLLRSQLGPGLKLVYAGEISGFRGLDLVLAAMPYVAKQDPATRFVVIGRGKPVAEKALSRAIDELGVGAWVMRLGWVPREHVTDYLAACDIGMAPFRPNPVFDATISNKIFDYMGTGLPVVATAVRPVARVLGETGAGLVTDPTPRSLAAAVLRLGDPALRLRMGMRGAEAVRQRYNWELEGRRFVHCLEAIARGQRPGRRPESDEGKPAEAGGEVAQGSVPCDERPRDGSDRRRSCP